MIRKILILISLLMIILLFLFLSPHHIHKQASRENTSPDKIPAASQDIQPTENPLKDIVKISLTNGGIIYGEVLQEEENGFKVDLGYGTTVLSKKDIEALERPKTEEQKKSYNDIFVNHLNTTSYSKEREKEASAYVKRMQEALKIRAETFLTDDELAEINANKNGATIIKFQSRRKIHTTAILSGQVSVNMLVDTGASSVIISSEIANKTPGVKIIGTSVPIQMADGRLANGIPITIRSIQVGNLIAKNVEAYVIPSTMERYDGLLGMTFLNRFNVSIDNRKKQMMLTIK